MNKIVLKAMVVVLILSSLVSNVHANPTEDVEQARWVVFSKLRGIEELLDNRYENQSGLMFNLNALIDYSIWVDFVYNDENLSFSESEKEGYRDSLISKYQDFNLRYSDGVEYPFSIRFADTGELEDTVSLFVEDSSLYLESLLYSISDLIGEGDRSREELIISQNRDLIRYIYSSLQSLVNEKYQMSRVLYSPEDDEYGTDLSRRIDSTLAEQILGNEVFSEILLRGRSLSQDSVESFGNIRYKNFDEYVPNLAKVVKKEDVGIADYGSDRWESSVESDLGFKLEEAYAAFMAASSVYIPYESYAGESEFLRSFTSLVEDEEEAKKFLALYGELKDRKKPLYMIEKAGWFEDNSTRDFSTFKAYSGEAIRATLESFENNIKEEKTGGLVTVKGNFTQVSEDSDTWAFVIGSETEEGPVDLDKGIVEIAKDRINTTHWTETIFEYGNLRGYPIVGLTLMKNIINDNKSSASLKNKERTYLFINSFGDIVTEDNLIIIPGAANPLYYDSVMGYNPYTVAFMNYYPSAYVSGNNLRIGARNDFGKYLLMSESEDMESEHGFMRIQKEDNLSITKYKRSINIFRDFSNFGNTDNKLLEFSDVTTNRFFDNFFHTIGRAIDFKETLKAHVVSSGARSIFPYHEGIQDYERISELLAHNMYWSYTQSGDNVLVGLNGRLREDYIFRNVLIEGVMGTIYVDTFLKNSVESYEQISEDTYGRFHSFIRGLSKNTLGFLGDIDGVLGLKNRYQDPIMGPLLGFIDEYFWFIFVGLVLVFIASFMRQRTTLSYTVVISLLALGIFTIMIRVVPVYIPSAFNLVVSNTSQDIGFDIISTKSEKYALTYREGGNINPDGSFLINTGSLNLYKFPERELRDFVKNYDIDYSNLKQGEVLIVDPEMGMYVEGDTLKVNIDVLLSTNPINGRYVENLDSTSYEYYSEKMVSSSLDYYTPYYLIIDGFIETLNNLLSVYSIPPNVISYGDGFSKNSFLVYNYINSIPFLSPADFENLNEYASPEEIERLKVVFGNPYDIIGLSKILESPSTEMRESLWYRTLEQNGFLEEDRLQKLVADVNYQVRRFLIDKSPKAGLISDENMIKIVSLYATMVFSQKVSDYGNWLYPVSLNYSEFTMSDVLMEVFVDDYGKFLSADMDVVDYVADNSGSITLIVFIVLMIISFIISMVLQYMTPVVYVGFLIILLLRFVMGKTMKSLVSGYVKVSLILFFSLSAYVWGMSFISKIGTTYAVYTLLILYIFLLYVLFQVVSSLVFNITELGNSSINAKFQGFGEKMGSMFSKIRSARMPNLRDLKQSVGHKKERWNYYDNVVDLDDVYFRTPRRGRSYSEDRGRSSYFEITEERMDEEEKISKTVEKVLSIFNRNKEEDKFVREDKTKKFDSLDDYKNSR